MARLLESAVEKSTYIARVIGFAEDYDLGITNYRNQLSRRI